jgi:hypothetical protein
MRSLSLFEIVKIINGSELLQDQLIELQAHRQDADAFDQTITDFVKSGIAEGTIPEPPEPEFEY